MRCGDKMKSFLAFALVFVVVSFVSAEKYFEENFNDGKVVFLYDFYRKTERRTPVRMRHCP